MAIYKNREVQVLGPNPQANSPESITVSYMDGTHENVRLSDVKFTKAEKDALVKAHPSKYDNVEVVRDEDVKAVRVGVPPASDKAAYEQARVQVQQEKQAEMSKKQMDEMRAKAQKDFEAQNKAPTTPTPPVVPAASSAQPRAQVAQPKAQVR